MKVTIDSSEPLEHALRVLGALYGVTLVVDAPGSAETPASRSKTTRKASGAPRKAPRVSRSRKSTARRATPARRAAAASVSNAELRDWARQHGYTVADRGRLPSEVVAAYQVAQQG